MKNKNSLYHKTVSNVVENSLITVYKVLIHEHRHLNTAHTILHNLPGHWTLLQLCSSVLDPGHEAPPCFGCGLLQNLNLVFFPGPHALVQSVHGDQSFHAPLIGVNSMVKTFDLRSCITEEPILRYNVGYI